jgi:hypothetical protein
VDERTGEAEILLHPGRIVHRIVFGSVLEPQIVQQPTSAHFRFAAIQPVHLANKYQDLAPAQIIVEHRSVGQIADAPFHLDPIALAIKPIDGDAAAGRHQDAHHDADGRGLAGAVGPEKTKHLAPADVEREVANGGERTVVLAQVTK